MNKRNTNIDSISYNYKSGYQRPNRKRYRTTNKFYIFLGILIALALIIGGVLFTMSKSGNGITSSKAKQLSTSLQKSDYAKAAALWDSYINTKEGEQKTTAEKELIAVMEPFLQEYVAYCGSSEYRISDWNRKYSGMNALANIATTPLTNAINNIVSDYYNGTINSADAKTKISNIAQLSFLADAKAAAYSNMDQLVSSNKAYTDGVSLYQQAKIKEALVALNKVNKFDKNYAAAQNTIKQCESTYMSTELSECKKLYDADDNANAYKRLLELSALFPNNEEINKLLPTYKAAAQSKDLVSVSANTTAHIFSHCLIAFPELSVSKPGGGTYDQDCITVVEFNRLLDSLYEKNYILVDINYIYETVTENGVTKSKLKNTIKLPRGKKPLILSVDDVTYDPAKKDNGMVDRLVLKDDRIQTYTKMPDGKEIYSTTNDIVPILDDFVASHPDFSWQGAKATLALTGFTGILGYRTDSSADAAIRAQAITDVKPIIQKLKDTGYNFASHGYGHRHMSKCSETLMTDDTSKWRNEVGSLVGDTNIYIYPYGEWTAANSAQHGVLLKYGFKVFCGVGSKQYLISGFPKAPATVGNIFMDRRPIDGQSLRAQYIRYQDMVDTYKMYDHEHRAVPFPQPSTTVAPSSTTIG